MFQCPEHVPLAISQLYTVPDNQFAITTFDSRVSLKRCFQRWIRTRNKQGPRRLTIRAIIAHPTNDITRRVVTVDPTVGVAPTPIRCRANHSANPSLNPVPANVHPIPAHPSRSTIPTTRLGLKITNVGRLGAAITTGHSFRASASSRKLGIAALSLSLKPTGHFIPRPPSSGSR